MPVHTKIRPSGRLSKQDRRRQLLDMAKQILAEDGGEGLTLALLAKRAGVSKPIAYDHFGTRAGLLVALLDDANTYYELDAEAKIQAAPQTVNAIASIVAEAYVRCALQAGPATVILSAAIAGDSSVRDAGKLYHADHADQFQRAFGPILASDARNVLLFKSLIGAANTICDERTSGAISTKMAIDTLTHLLVTSLSPLAHPDALERAET